VFLSCGSGRCIIVIIVIVVVAAAAVVVAVAVVVVVVDDDDDDNNNNNYGTLLRTITIYSDKSQTKSLENSTKRTKSNHFKRPTKTLKNIIITIKHHKTIYKSDHPKIKR
jgi:negative regulator of sigma E activity